MPLDSSDEEIYNMPPSRFEKALRRHPSRDISSLSLTNKSVRIDALSPEVLQIWSELPEAIRLDPSLLAYKTEYDKIAAQKGVGTSESRDCLILNMSISKASKNSDDEEALIEQPEKFRAKKVPLCRLFKLFALIIGWISLTFVMIVTGEKVFALISISKNSSTSEYFFLNSQNGRRDSVGVMIEGSIVPENDKKSNESFEETKNNVTIWVELWSNSTGNGEQFKMNLSDTWVVASMPPELIDVFPSQRRQHRFLLKSVNESVMKNSSLVLHFQTTYKKVFNLSISYDFASKSVGAGAAVAAAVLLALYFLIVFEIMHRTLAVYSASIMSLAILALWDKKPGMKELISWIDVDTLLLLLSMMMLVTVFGDTGIFDFMAVYAFKIASGRTWPLVNTLCIFTAVISAFLDNVTTVLLMTPVTIRLCEVTNLNPVPVLTIMLIYSNLGGAMTPVGDPPNVIILSSNNVKNAGINFGIFTMHMSIGIILVAIVIHLQLRWAFRRPRAFKYNEPRDVQDLRQKICTWERAAASLSSYNKYEGEVRLSLTKKVNSMCLELNRKLLNKSDFFHDYKSTLEELQKKYPIRNPVLLFKASCALVFVVLMFFLQSLPQINLSLGCSAFFGVLLLLLVADEIHFDGLMARVEWSTLCFFAALFILMEALTKLGLISWIGTQTENIVLSVNEESRLAVAIILILWVSAFASAFVDNVPLTTMMVRIATTLAENQRLKLPLKPLVWALAFGACLGGNGTLIGSTANVVCAGVAEQHGYKFTFMQFFKIGFPVMITSTTIAMIYLVLAHVVFEWNV